MKLEWEMVEQSGASGAFQVRRARVVGGWLFAATEDVRTPRKAYGSSGADVITEEGFEWRTSICFVPDGDLS